MRYHIDDDGNVGICRAKKGRCPFTVHGETPELTRKAGEEANQHNVLAPGVTKLSPTVSEFSSKCFYGRQRPRDIQLEALNDVARALDEDDSTQLVAACGTGKSYMGRQLLNREMNKIGANGISVILTSSIKLATDTANDLRPRVLGDENSYDGSLGVFGEDYEVIEVHSDASPVLGRQSVRADGVISVERIRKQLEDAITSGKRIVIVSTYDSANKVQEAQALFEDQERVQADIIMHDEAHNILGQQIPTTVASDENELTAFTGFHNSIPGAIQSRKRLYATATPAIREVPEDNEPPESLEDAIKIANAMKAGNQKARVTYYSDNAEIVGKISGFISQEAAVESNCLSEPVYEIRESSVKGRLQDYVEPVVAPGGNLQERGESSANNPLTVNTYGAVRATLDSLVTDPEEGRNGANNVLAYVGSINQAEAFKEAFRDVAKSESRGISLEEAQAGVNSIDPITRRRARMLLLSENAEVLAAHSNTDRESRLEREKAFDMFRGHAAVSGEWTPNKRVLANVDIFSEGVSIPEIDAVVIADDDKCNERSMTQAIGRSIRVVSGNSYKNTGHVIVPSITDESGIKLNEASVHVAAYGATRVERAVSASKVRGEGIRPDTKTVFKVFKQDGSVEQKKARNFAQDAVEDTMALAAASEITSAHQYLVQYQEGYRDLSPGEQASVIKSRIAEKALDKRKGKENIARLQEVSEFLKGKSAHEMRELRRNGRVVTSAISSGDVSSLSPSISRSLVNAGVLRPKTGIVPKITLEDKRKFLEDYKEELGYAVITSPAKMTEDHKTALSHMGIDERARKTLVADGMRRMRGMGGNTPKTDTIDKAFDNALKNDAFVEAMFEATQKSSENFPALSAMQKERGKSFFAESARLEKVRSAKQLESAVSGEVEYEVDPSKVRKTGELSSASVNELHRLYRSLVDEENWEDF